MEQPWALLGSFYRDLPEVRGTQRPVDNHQQPWALLGSFYWDLKEVRGDTNAR